MRIEPRILQVSALETYTWLEEMRAMTTTAMISTPPSWATQGGGFWVAIRVKKIWTSVLFMEIGYGYRVSGSFLHRSRKLQVV